ncbi:MFS transporter [Nakamurella lactea]|uniref:MFS transporter n=1 Tax=Nakamurella lactea TaxID=459515 RepID=UPI000428BC96|nr:MFS transporter [Nakamurella lactea]
MTAAGRTDPALPPASELRRVLVALCITQITSWGVLYYAFPVMLTAVTSDTGWSNGTALGAFSVGLLASAVAAPLTGRLIDRHGPRPVMTIGSVLGAGSLVAVAGTQQLGLFFAAWVLVGLAQSAVLYPPAFAALTRWCGPDRVRAITTVTLVGGLASTVFAPLTAGLLHAMSWRQTCLVLAIVLGAVTIPLHAFMLTPGWHRGSHRHSPADPTRPPRSIARTARSRPFVLFVLALTLAGFGMFGATLNLIPLLADRGIGTSTAAVIFGLIGVGQLLGRFFYPALARNTRPQTRTAAVLAAGAAAVAVLGLLGGSVGAFVVVAICAGAARGTFTLLQATGVSDRWGTANFASLNGIAGAAPAAAIVGAPAGAAFLADRLGSYTAGYLLLAGLTLAGALIALGTGVAPDERRG